MKFIDYLPLTKVKRYENVVWTVTYPRPLWWWEIGEL